MSVEREGNSFDEDFLDLKNRLEVCFGDKGLLNVWWSLDLFNNAFEIMLLYP